MNIDNSKNKMMTASPEEYHFAGEGKYHPVSVKATSTAEAEKKWREVRKEIGQTETTEQKTQDEK